HVAEHGLRLLLWQFVVIGEFGGQMPQRYRGLNRGLDWQWLLPGRGSLLRWHGDDLLYSPMNTEIRCRRPLDSINLDEPEAGRAAGPSLPVQFDGILIASIVAVALLWRGWVSMDSWSSSAWKFSVKLWLHSSGAKVLISPHGS